MNPSAINQLDKENRILICATSYIEQPDGTLEDSWFEQLDDAVTPHLNKKDKKRFDELISELAELVEYCSNQITVKVKKSL